MITQKLWCDFLNTVKKRSSSIGLIILLASITPFSHGSEQPQLFQLELVRKNQTGPNYQVGDRIEFSIPLPVSLLHQNPNIQIKYIDEQKTLDQLGIYLDQSPQVINGALRFAIYPVQSGSITLPELSVIKEPDSIIGKTSPYTIEVIELKKSEEQPDLIDAISVSMPLKFILMGLVLLALVIGLVIYFYKKTRSRKVVTTAVEIKPPPIPDYEIALREIESLYSRFSYSPENLKPIAFGLSEILKKYFSSRFKIDAVESTTDEMIQLLQTESVNESDLSKIRSLFNDLDIIKFTEQIHHQHFQKSDFLTFKDQSSMIVNRWSNRQGVEFK
jgi:hypothetical protein